MEGTSEDLPALRPQLRAPTQLTTAGQETATSSLALVVDSRAPAGEADSLGILIQQRAGESVWTTVGTIHPRVNFASLAVRVGAIGSLRLLFGRGVSVRAIGQLTATEATLPRMLSLSGAEHSRLGPVMDAVGAGGGETTTLLPGEAVRLDFAPSELAAGSTRELFVVAHGAFKPVVGAPQAQSSGIAASASPAWQIELGNAEPNPSSGGVHLSYTLAEPGLVSIRVYNIAGRLVRTLVDESPQVGVHDIVWNATDDGGRRVPAGVYFYRMTAGAWQSQRKVVFLGQ